MILALALVGAVGYGLAHRPPSLELTVLPPQPTSLPTPLPTAGPVRCHIVGPVNAPGVYTLPPNSRVQDALQVAGGPTADADLERLNLAAIVQDQDQIIVPWRTVDLTTRSLPSVRGSSTDLVNVNIADSETLQTLPGIGPVLAGRIIDYRNAHGPFDTVESLVEVKGIGAATLDKLRPLITLGP